MKIAPLLIALKPQQHGFRRAQHILQIDEHLHIITITYDSCHSQYRLVRTVVDALSRKCEEHIRNFRYLTDLFAYAKQEGFFEDVAPHSLGWKGYTEPKPTTIRETSYYGYYTEEPSDEKEEEEARIEALWDGLGKREIITYEDEGFDDGGHEFSWAEPEDNNPF